MDMGRGSHGPPLRQLLTLILKRPSRDTYDLSAHQQGSHPKSIHSDAHGTSALSPLREWGVGGNVFESYK